jgi:hypothetical protein
MSGVTVHQEYPGSDPVTTVDFPPFDLQAGFAVTLRQCDDTGEPASFSKVKNAIALAGRTRPRTGSMSLATGAGLATSPAAAGSVASLQACADRLGARVRIHH